MRTREEKRENEKRGGVKLKEKKTAAVAADRAQLTYNLLVKLSRAISRDYF